MSSSQNGRCRLLTSPVLFLSYILAFDELMGDDSSLPSHDEVVAAMNQEEKEGQDADEVDSLDDDLESLANQSILPDDAPSDRDSEPEEENRIPPSGG